jgi:hypothetical protein
MNFGGTTNPDYNFLGTGATVFTGNVGIGGVSPGSRALFAEGTGTTTAQIQADRGAATALTNRTVTFRSVTTGAAVQGYGMELHFEFTDGGGSSVLSNIRVMRGTVGTSGEMEFETVNAGASPGTALFLRQDHRVELPGHSAPAVSTAGSGALYFDSTSNTFKISQNAGAYVDIGTALFGGGWTKTGTDVHLTTSTDSVGIGTASPARKLDVTDGGQSTKWLVKDFTTTPDFTIPVDFGPAFYTAVGEVGAGYIASASGVGVIPEMYFYRSRGDTVTPTSVVDNDVLMNINVNGHLSGFFQNPMQIQAAVDGTPGGTVPVRLDFIYNGVTEMSLNNSGFLGVGVPNPQTRLSVSETGGIDPAAGMIPANTDLNLYKNGFTGGAPGIGVIFSELGTPALGGAFRGIRSRGTVAVPATVVNGDHIMSIEAYAHEGTALQNTANIRFEVDGVPSAGNMPTRILFQTGPAATPITRMTIDSTGKITIPGLIDPTGLQFSRESANPGTADTLYVDDGTQGTAGDLFFGGTNISAGLSSPSGGGWTDDGTTVRLTTSTDSVGIGTASVAAGNKIHAIAPDGVRAARFERTRTTGTGSASTAIEVATISAAASISDGFGTGINFRIGDSVADQGVATINAVRDTADNSGALTFLTTDVGSLNEAMRITHDQRVAVGLTAPSGVFHASGDGNAVSSSLYFSGDPFVFSDQNNSPATSIIVAGAAANRGVYKATKSRGTLAAPTAAVSGDNIWSAIGVIYDGAALRATAEIATLADGAVSSGNAPQRIEFLTGTTTTRTTRMTIASGGTVDVAGDLDVGGKLTVTGLIDPTGLQFDRVSANPGTSDTIYADDGTQGTAGDLFYGSANVSNVLNGIFAVADDTASVFSVAEGANNYIGVTTTDGSETVILGNVTTLPTIALVGPIQALGQISTGTPAAVSFNEEGIRTIDGDGGGVRLRVDNVETVATTSGASVSTSGAAQFGTGVIGLGVNIRITTTITGPTSIDVGVSGDATRFIAGLSTLTAGTSEEGVSVDVYTTGSTPILITANGGNFTAGAIRVQLVELNPQPFTS